MIFRLRLFLRRLTPLTVLIWFFLWADLREPGYGRFNFVVATVDAADVLSIIRTGAEYDGDNTQPD